jgi:DNA-directed RNA polymerase specialized sigma24 family protein
LNEAVIDPATEAALRRGAPEGIEALWNSHGPRLRRLCRSVTGDEGHADEVTADLFISLYQRASAGPFEPDFDTWLFASSVEFLRTVQPRSPTPVHGDESERVDAILAELPIDDRLVLALHDIQGLDAGATARAMGVTEHDVRRQVDEARHRFEKRWDVTGRSREPNR